MHFQEAKLASIVAVMFGVLLALLGALMIIGLDFSPDAAGSAALVWGGLAIALAGKQIRRTRTLLKRPRWFFAACIFGISSSGGLYKTILTDDSAGTIGMIPMQIIALYALWQACRKEE